VIVAAVAKVQHEETVCRDAGKGGQLPHLMESLCAAASTMNF